MTYGANVSKWLNSHPGAKYIAYGQDYTAPEAALAPKTDETSGRRYKAQRGGGGHYFKDCPRKGSVADVYREDGHDRES